MRTKNTHSPLPGRPPAGPLEHELAPLMTELFAGAWQPPADEPAAAAATRIRLLERLAVSRAAEAPMFTARRRAVRRDVLADGVAAQTLYTASAGHALRPGEPLRARLIELAAGTRLRPEMLGTQAELRPRHREWLVLSGNVRSGDDILVQRDYHVTPAGHGTPDWACGTDGALLFLRESEAAAAPADLPFTLRDADAGWSPFAAGIRRRVLWQRDGQAALLYSAQPGAQVPNHTHGHDEECLMVQGELFLDDVLLQLGDYQLAPAGTGHRITETDTGVVIYAHGDLDLKFVA